MRLYEEKIAPNARRVRMFLAEKGIKNIEFVELNTQKGDNLTPEFRQKNPLAKVPVLELDDGTVISESVAICRYFEALESTNLLMGETPLQQAQIEMWQRRCEIYFMNMVGMGFQHTSGYFSDRMKPISEWGEECVKYAAGFMKMLDQHLANHEYVAGDAFSIADITAFVTVDFARVVKLRPSEDMLHLKRWYGQINKRPSAAA